MAGNDEIGPVEHLIVEFPDNRMTGEGLPLLVDTWSTWSIEALSASWTWCPSTRV
ncbi:MAG: hypothetical protein ABI563_05310 [Specibacter sp.]